MRTTKTAFLFGDLKVLNALSLSWVAGQFKNATAKTAEGNKDTAQDSLGIGFISEGEAAG